MNYEDIKQRAKVVQEQMMAFQQTVQAFKVAGTSGGGLVTVTLSGCGAMTQIDIDDSLLIPEEKGVLEDLLIAAFEDARRKMEKLTSEEMTKMRGELQLPAELIGSEG